MTADGIALEPDEYELALETSGRPEGEALALLPSGGFVLLDTATTPELEAEGWPATSSAPCRTPGRPPASTSATGSACSCASTTPRTPPPCAAFEIADVAGETLASQHAVRTRTPSSPSGSTRTVRRRHSGSGTYANRGAFTVAVSRIGASA